MPLVRRDSTSTLFGSQVIYLGRRSPPFSLVGRGYWRFWRWLSQAAEVFRPFGDILEVLRAFPSIGVPKRVGKEFMFAIQQSTFFLLAFLSCWEYLTRMVGTRSEACDPGHGRCLHRSWWSSIHLLLIPSILIVTHPIYFCNHHRSFAVCCSLFILFLWHHSDPLISVSASRVLRVDL